MGATLYFMLLNKRPFDSKERHIPMSPSLIDPSVPTHLERILLKCLALNPEDRFDSIEEIMLELNRVDPSDQPLVGREEVIQQIAQCLQRVHQGEQLHVHFVGTRGSGKTWAKDTLCEAACTARITDICIGFQWTLQRVYSRTNSRSISNDCL